MSWCTIESDPGVFTELIQAFGVTDVHFREFYSMDDAAFREQQPHGLVFLFRWTKAAGAPPSTESGTRFYEGPEVYFANQVINNACGTLALLHILLNCDSKIEIGYKAFTSAIPPQLAGEALNDQPAIRIAHNSFARPEPFVYEKSVAKDDDDVYHFISYVAVGNQVFELDGLKRAPVLLGEVPESGEWYSVAREAINRRISQSESTELRWALMGLRDNESKRAVPELARCEARLAAVLRAQGGGDGKVEDDGDAVMGDESFEIAESVDELEAQKLGLEEKIRSLKVSIRDEKAMFAKWKKENIRRKHNYIPFAVELLRVLADKKELTPLVEAGRKKATEARERAVKREKERAEAKKLAEASAGDAVSGSTA